MHTTKCGDKSRRFTRRNLYNEKLCEPKIDKKVGKRIKNIQYRKNEHSCFVGPTLKPLSLRPIKQVGL
jgi:hypothetical protein